MIDSLVIEGACEATTLFISGCYEECLQTLQRLEGIAGGHQVAHNISVVEYYCGGCTGRQKLSDQLSLVSASAASSDEGEPSTSSASAAASSAGGTGGTPAGGGAARPAGSHSMSASSSTSAHSDTQLLDIDTSVCRLNKAILLYQQNQHASAAALLTPILQCWGDAAVEVLQEGVVLRSACLLLDMHLAAGQLTLAASMLAFLERVCTHLAGREAQPSGPAPGLCPSPKQLDSTKRYGVPEAGGTSASSSHSLCLPRTSKWRSGVVFEPVSLLLRSRGHSPPPAPDLKMLVKMYRARLYCANGNLRAAKRLLKGIHEVAVGPSGGSGLSGALGGGVSNGAVANGGGSSVVAGGSSNSVSGGGGSVASVLSTVLRAKVELLNGSPRKCGKVLLALLQELPADVPAAAVAPAAAAAGAAANGGSSGTATAGPLSGLNLRVPLLNNLGVAHAQQGKHALAALYCSQALMACGTPGPAPAQDSHVAPRDAAGGTPHQASASHHYCATLYNLGLQHLMSSRWQLARRCFQQAVPQYYAQPLLWLRMGESALGLARQMLADRRDGSTAGAGEGALHPVPPNGLVRAVVQSGSVRRIVLPSGNAASSSCHVEANAAGSNNASSSGAGTATPISLAREAVSHLDSALHLLDLQQQQQHSSAVVGAAGSVASTTRSAELKQGVGGSGDVLYAAGTTVPEASAAAAAAAATENGGSAAAAAAAAAHAGAAADAVTAAAAAGQRQQQQLVEARRSALASLAYAHLLLGDHLAALTFARSLLLLPALPAPSHLLASCYAAEALTMVGRASEAADVLAAAVAYQQQVQVASQQQQQIQFSSPQGQQRPTDDDGDDGAHGEAGRQDDGESLPSSSSGGGGGIHAASVAHAGRAPADVAALTGHAAMAALYVNLASLYASHGALSQAQQLARQALGLLAQQQAGAGMGTAAPVPAAAAALPAAAVATRNAAMLLLVFTELASGNAPAALALLRGHRIGG